MMVANIEGLAGFTKRNRRSCEIFYARRKNTLYYVPICICVHSCVTRIYPYQYATCI